MKKNILTKVFLVIAIFIANASASDDKELIKGTWSGTAKYVKKGFFGTKKDSFRMIIRISNDDAILSLPAYGCDTRLILAAQSEDGSFTCGEEQIRGKCEIDERATTTIKIDENKLYYTWKKSDSEGMTATLSMNK